MDQREQENGEGNGAPAGRASPEMDAVPDLIDTLRATREATGEAGDVTLAGYTYEHERPPAFEGSDGDAYTVDVAVEETGEAERPFVAYLLFLRWAATGAGIMGHVESGDVASGRTEEEARAATGNLTLWELKAELDAALERRGADQ
ncbi:MAG TPA: hypothetical protein VMK65_00780 [Longimicrobiales bacterium]|nr:hypothetical protein [Longimicrobiales bacterium]